MNEQTNNRMNSVLWPFDNLGHIGRTEGYEVRLWQSNSSEGFMLISHNQVFNFPKANL